MVKYATSYHLQLFYNLFANSVIDIIILLILSPPSPFLYPTPTLFLCKLPTMIRHLFLFSGKRWFFSKMSIKMNRHFCLIIYKTSLGIKVKFYLIASQLIKFSL